MHLQEAITELEKGHRIFKAFELSLDIIKKLQQAEMDLKTSAVSVSALKKEIKELEAEKKQAQDFIKQAKAEAKNIISSAENTAKETIDKKLDESQIELDEKLKHKLGAEQDAKAAKTIQLEAEKATKTARAELQNIESQIANLKSKLKGLL